MDPLNDLPPQIRRQVEEALLEARAARQRMPQHLAGRPTRYTPGGRAVKQSIWEHLAKGGQAALEGYNARAYSGQVDSQLAEAEKGRSADISKVMEALAGKPGMYELPEGQAGPQVPPVPGDPQEAIRTALASQYPSVRAQGLDLQKRGLDQRGKVIEALLKDSSPASTQTFLSTNDPTKLQPKPQYQPMGDALVTTNPNQPGATSVTPNRFQQGTQSIAGTPIPTNVDTFSGKETPMAGTSVNANPALASKTRASEFDLKQITEGRPVAQKLAQGLGIIQDISQGLQQAYTNGSLADIRTQVGKFATLIGGTPRPEDINAEYIDSLLKKLGIADAKSLGVNPTDRDLQIIRESVGSINTDPQALPRLLQTVYRLNATALGQFNGYVTRAQEVEQQLDPTADYSRWQVGSQERGEPHPYANLQGVIDAQSRGQGIPPTQPPAGRRRIDLSGR